MQVHPTARPTFPHILTKEGQYQGLGDFCHGHVGVYSHLRPPLEKYRPRGMLGINS